MRWEWHWLTGTVGMSTAYWFSILRISRIVHTINFVLQFLYLASKFQNSILNPPLIFVLQLCHDCGFESVWKKLVSTPALWFEFGPGFLAGCNLGGGGVGGDFRLWTCTNPQCRANKCWPTRSISLRCGAPRGFGAEPQPQGGRPENNITQGVPHRFQPALLPRCQQKRLRQHATARFPTPVPLSKVQLARLEIQHANVSWV